jgi:POT family proton-dependent oligopeptide transporter
MPAALVADLWLGRYWTLVISIMYVGPSEDDRRAWLIRAHLYRFSASGCLIQLITSIPTLSDGGGGAAGIALSMLLVGAGAGGVKAVFSPFLG